MRHLVLAISTAHMNCARAVESGWDWRQRHIIAVNVRMCSKYNVYVFVSVNGPGAVEAAVDSEQATNPKQLSLTSSNSVQRNSCGNTLSSIAIRMPNCRGGRQIKSMHKHPPHRRPLSSRQASRDSKVQPTETRCVPARNMMSHSAWCNGGGRTFTPQHSATSIARGRSHNHCASGS